MHLQSGVTAGGWWLGTMLGAAWSMTLVGEMGAGRWVAGVGGEVGWATG